MCHGGKKIDKKMSLLVGQMEKNDFPDLAKHLYRKKREKNMVFTCPIMANML